jgi:Fe/S biogenesis protein NfuA
MITFSEAAKQEIGSVIKEQSDGRTLLRIEAHYRGAVDFSYGLSLVGPDEKAPEDLVIDAGEFSVVVDPDSLKNLQGASIDFVDDADRSGFRFINPNVPPIPGLGDGPRPDLTGPLAERVQQLFETELNPAVGGHGGMIRFLGVRDNRVYVAFGGGCRGCGMVNVTLKQGVEARIRELFPEIEEVVDVTDHGRPSGCP